MVCFSVYTTDMNLILTLSFIICTCSSYYYIDGDDRAIRSFILISRTLSILSSSSLHTWGAKPYHRSILVVVAFQAHNTNTTHGTHPAHIPFPPPTTYIHARIHKYGGQVWNAGHQPWLLSIRRLLCPHSSPTRHL